jgi:tRNA-specific 2-thiouridylase
VGRHDGLLRYTVGQRKGISVSGLGDGPWYIVKTDAVANAVVVGRREDLARKEIVCSRANVLRADRFASNGSATGLAACRYRAALLPARATIVGDSMRVHLDEPVAVVSPGQLLVLYDDTGDEVIASGIIEG